MSYPNELRQLRPLRHHFLLTLMFAREAINGGKCRKCRKRRQISCITRLEKLKIYMSSSKPKNTWISHMIGALDFFEASTVSVFEWMEGLNCPDDGWWDFLQAVAVVTREPLWEWRLSGPPRVGYDPVSDGPVFIFKLSRNGTTFVVCQRPMPELYS